MSADWWTGQKARRGRLGIRHVHSCKEQLAKDKFEVSLSELLASFRNNHH